MNLEDFDYPLPKELIAQKPLAQRDTSKLLVVDRKGLVGAYSCTPLHDKHFSDILEYIPTGDVLVLNDTKVFPARLLGKKKVTEGKVEVLLLSPVAGAWHAAPLHGNVWRCLVQPALKEGQEIEIGGTAAEAVFRERDKDGIPVLEFSGVDDVRALAEKIGSMPLPPYIKREADSSDKESYQTVYAEKEGAVAAPTAGFHFTKGLLGKIQAKGIEILHVTLHVGYGTFKPVEDLENHRMQAERFELTEQVAGRLNLARSEKRGIWAVGTTTLRALESCVQDKKIIPGKGETDLYIKPPFEFEAVDHLITNFHLPKTTLLLLTSAFMGESLRKKAYAHAVAEKYRFYSYGDAMLIL